MGGNAQEKTEAPTGKRVSEARKKGQIAKSRDLTAVSILITGGGAIYLSRNLILANFRQIIESAWSTESFSVPGYFAVSSFSGDMIISMFSMLAPIVMTIVATAVILNLVQMKGFILSFEAMKISFGNLNPLSGFKKLFSLRSLTELIKSIFKMAIISLCRLLGAVARTRCFMRVGRAGGMRFFVCLTGTLALKLLFRVAGIMLVLSFIDLSLPESGRREKIS